ARIARTSSSDRPMIPIAPACSMSRRVNFGCCHVMVAPRHRKPATWRREIKLAPMTPFPSIIIGARRDRHEKRREIGVLPNVIGCLCHLEVSISWGFLCSPLGLRGCAGMIHVDKLTKYYGDYPAVQDVSFDVPAGQMLGFLGPNGAGKSTTMRILAGYITATSGSANIAGLDVFWDSVEVRRKIGYMPESCPLYKEMRVDEYLHFRAGI